MTATEQILSDMSKYYGRYNGNIQYQEEKLKQKLKVVLLAVLCFVMLHPFLTDVKKVGRFEVVLLFTVFTFVH